MLNLCCDCEVFLQRDLAVLCTLAKTTTISMTSLLNNFCRIVDFFFSSASQNVLWNPWGNYKKYTANNTLQLLCISEIITSSRKTKKVTFLSIVATMVPSVVKSWSPLGAWLGHFCCLGLNLNSFPSVQLFDNALRYLKISPKKTEMLSTTGVKLDV